MRGVIGMFLRRRLRVCEMLFVLLIMPPSKVVPTRQCLQRQEQDRKFRVPLHYYAEGLALQCFLVEVINNQHNIAAQVSNITYTKTVFSTTQHEGL